MSKKISPAETSAEEIEEALTDEEIARLEQEREEEREARLAPFRAMHEQQNEQDDLLAELLYRETLRELEV